jgi:hypothetical protein
MFKLFGVIAKVVKIGGICNVFYIYANNLYNPLFVFSVFGFRKHLDRQALFMDFACSCRWIVRPLHQKQTDIEKDWVSQKVTVVSI